MTRSKTPLRKWLIAMFLLTSHPKGASSIKLARDLGITQSTAWTMAQKIRQGWIQDKKLSGTVEVDETFVGGKESNKPSPQTNLHQRPRRKDYCNWNEITTGK